MILSLGGVFTNDVSRFVEATKDYTNGLGVHPVLNFNRHICNITPMPKVQERNNTKEVTERL